MHTTYSGGYTVCLPCKCAGIVYVWRGGGGEEGLSQQLFKGIRQDQVTDWIREKGRGEWRLGARLHVLLVGEGEFQWVVRVAITPPAEVSSSTQWSLSLYEQKPVFGLF
jgi:hypothetical protein